MTKREELGSNGDSMVQNGMYPLLILEVCNGNWPFSSMIYDDLMIFNSYVASGTVQQPSWKAMIIMNWELCSETYINIYIYIHRDGFEHSVAILSQGLPVDKTNSKKRPRAP